MNLALSILFAEEIRPFATPVLIRDRDATLLPSERVARTKELKADYLICIHSDSFYDPNAHGSGTFVFAHGGEPQKLAKYLLRGLTAANGLTNRGVRTKNYYELRETRHIPAVLVETAFLSNPREEKLLTDPAFLRRCARGLADGLRQYLGVAEGFSDIAGHHLEAAVWRAAELKLMCGYPDGTFRPDQPPTRAELAAVAVRIVESKTP